MLSLYLCTVVDGCVADMLPVLILTCNIINPSRGLFIANAYLIVMRVLTDLLLH